MVLMEELTYIQVFSTNVFQDFDKERVATILSAEPLIEEWNIAMDDRDRVLRVVSHELQPHQIIQLVNKCGYECRELE